MEQTVFGLPVMTALIYCAVPAVIIAGLIVWGIKYDPDKKHFS